MKNHKPFIWSGRGLFRLPERQAVAVYANNLDQIVIRQDRHPYDDEDAVVVLNRHDIQPLVAALTDLESRLTTSIKKG